MKSVVALLFFLLASIRSCLGFIKIEIPNTNSCTYAYLEYNHPEFTDAFLSTHQESNRKWVLRRAGFPKYKNVTDFMEGRAHDSCLVGFIGLSGYCFSLSIRLKLFPYDFVPSSVFVSILEKEAHCTSMPSAYFYTRVQISSFSANLFVFQLNRELDSVEKGLVLCPTCVLEKWSPFVEMSVGGPNTNLMTEWREVNHDFRRNYFYITARYIAWLPIHNGLEEYFTERCPIQKEFNIELRQSIHCQPLQLLYAHIAVLHNFTLVTRYYGEEDPFLLVENDFTDLDRALKWDVGEHYKISLSQRKERIAIMPYCIPGAKMKVATFDLTFWLRPFNPKTVIWTFACFNGLKLILALVLAFKKTWTKILLLNTLLVFFISSSYEMYLSTDVTVPPQYKGNCLNIT